MIAKRAADERGVTRLDWLDSRHSFSFDQYYDPRHMGFRTLRVINDDRVAPGAGFPTHGHRDMEILTYVLEGALEHQDSAGGGGVLRPGQVQHMTAGAGIRHSEFNPSPTDPVRLLQIWILPAERGLKPGYDQRAFAPEALAGKLALVASPDGRDGSLRIRQDASVYAARAGAGGELRHALAAGRHAWLQVASGSLWLNGLALQAGDGAAVSQEGRLEIRASQPSELLLFDLA